MAAVPSRAHLAWPFFGPAERDFRDRLDAALAAGALTEADHHDTDGSVRGFVRQLGAAGLLRACVPASHGGLADPIDSRLLCLARERLAYHDGLADFAFAMQGLGSGAIGLAGSQSLQASILPKIARGEWIAAFALSEAAAGSDVAAMTMEARAEGESYILTGEKTWISNGGIADVYTVVARTGEAPGARGLSAFVVFADDPGFSVVERIEVIAPHPLARIRFEACRIPAARRLGAPGEGFKIAMRTLDIFRASVAAAALGFARRAFDEAVAHAQAREMFGQHLADFQLTQAKLAEMATMIDAAALLTYRAAWTRDVASQPTAVEAAMAKMTATENAQIVIDQAVQMFGGRGVRSGEVVERLYREIRALRIYEGATEVQKLIIARAILKEATAPGGGKETANA
jgi:acyl-CoA dehydrogenase